MPRGNPNIKDYSPMVNNTPVNPEENKLMIEHCLEMFNAKEPDLHKPEEVEESINQYFRSCISKGLRPGNMGLYNALGITKSEAFDITHGRTPGKANPATVQLIKKAQKTLSEFRETLGSAGKLSPPVLIFWQKNFDGLEDIQRVELDANAAPKAEKTPEEIAAMIESDIPIDAEYTEKPL